MSFWKLLVKNAFRNRFRTILTIAGMAIAILGFLFLRTVVEIWNSGITGAAADRLVVRHKIGITQMMPRTYFNRIQDNVPAVKQITYANWSGHTYPKDPDAFFANFAVDADTYFEVYNDMGVPPEQFAQWKADPAGAVVGDLLAAKYGWTIGDRVTLQGTFYPGDWSFTIRGFYVVKNKMFDRYSFVYHWKYLNDGVPELLKEQVGWYAIRVADAAQGPQIGRQIDALFASSEAETTTESERAFNLSFMSMYSAIFTALHIVSMVILAIMAMIVGNTMAMGVRERTSEYGVLRALGFVPRQLASMVLGETMVIAVIGGALGILLAVPLVNGFGVFVEENFGNMFPYFRLEAPSVILAAVLAVNIGWVAAALPARAVSKLNVISALRRVG